jgi:hypothetical protein
MDQISNTFLINDETFAHNPFKYMKKTILEILQLFCTDDDLKINFQDMIATNTTTTTTSIKKSKRGGLQLYLKRLASDIEDIDDVFERMEECSKFREHYLMCIGIMIGNEIALAPANYLVFYRIVDENIILCEFNTLMLDIFAANTFDCDRSVDGKPLSLICTNCILEDVYPDSVSEHLHLMKTKEVLSDLSKGAREYLLSVNNCLSISNIDTDHFYKGKHLHESEAHPLSFPDGYLGDGIWESFVCKFLVNFFEQSDEVADSIVKQMIRKYNIRNLDVDDVDHCSYNSLGDDDGDEIKNLGHLIQICIPKECVDKFAYPCFAWGSPASIYTLDKKNPRALSQSMFDDEIPSNSLGKMSFQEIMNSQYMGKVQSRILAHPNLYLEHGAFTQVVSGSREFDRRQFQDDLREILAPLISDALARGKRLNYSKFKNE